MKTTKTLKSMLENCRYSTYICNYVYSGTISLTSTPITNNYFFHVGIGEKIKTELIVGEEAQTSNVFNGRTFRNKKLKGIIEKLEVIPNVGTVAHIRCQNNKLRVINICWLERTKASKTLEEL